MEVQGETAQQHVQVFHSRLLGRAMTETKPKNGAKNTCAFGSVTLWEKSLNARAVNKWAKYTWKTGEKRFNLQKRRRWSDGSEGRTSHMQSLAATVARLALSVNGTMMW